MMEESSDEQPEIISHEEAQLAEKEAGFSSVSAPAPLPDFMTKTSNTTPTVKPSVTMVGEHTEEKDTVHLPEPDEKVSSPIRHQATAPVSMETPYEASERTSVTPISTGTGLFGWLAGNSLVSKVMEKTKSSMESVITTLDPQMKEVIKSGGNINVMVTSVKEAKVGAVREAFQTVFGRATVKGMESQATMAVQPVGCTAGLKGAEERIQNIRQGGTLPEHVPIVSVEGFILELLPDRWYEMSCLILQDPIHRIDLQTFSQPAPIPTEYVMKAQDKTPSSYPLRWSGLAVSIGQIVEESQPHIGRTDWQSVLVGVSRRESLLMAARALAYMYQQRLPTSFIS